MSVSLASRLALRSVSGRYTTGVVAGGSRTILTRGLATAGGGSAHESATTAAGAAETPQGISTPTPRHVLSPYERFIVRITRSHRGADVPTTIGPEEMDRVNSRFRIGLMGVMMLLTLGVCLYAIQQGKKEKAAHSNQMVYARNRDRYK